MANILVNPALWKSLQDVTIPPSWDAANGWFEWFGYFGVGGPAQGLEYIGPPSDLPETMTIQIIAGPDIYSVPTYLRFRFIRPTGNTTQDILLVKSTTTSLDVDIPLNATSIELDIRSDPAYAYSYSMEVSLKGLSVYERAQANCLEKGGVTRAYMSSHFRDRMHVSNLFANEKRCLVTNANAVIGTGRRIISATWSTWNGSSVYMSDGAIVGKEARVTVAVQTAGHSIIRCTLTLDNGEKYVQNFRINVMDQHYYAGETYTTGPTSLTVTA